MNEKSQTKNFEIIFGEEQHEIESATLTTYLLNFSNLLQEVNQELNPGTKLKIKIQAFAPGSFKVQYRAENEIDPDNLFKDSADTQKNVDEVMSVSHEILRIKKHVGGSMPTLEHEGEKIKIINDKGEIELFREKAHKMYVSNRNIDNYAQKQFEIINADENIEEVIHKANDEEVMFDLQREEFPLMSTVSPLVDHKTLKPEVLKDQTLTLFKLVFERGYKWEFIYKQRKISATISDEALYDKIDEGSRFGKGDRFIVDLKEVKEFDETLQDYVIRDKDYEVIEYKKHIERPKQLRFEDGQVNSDTD
jgi:hypothetical protein